jgi:hypothetical protein
VSRRSSDTALFCVCWFLRVRVSHSVLQTRSMCSYAALTNPALQSDSSSHPHSEPCCASKFFAITKMQEEFGFKGCV